MMAPPTAFWAIAPVGAMDNAAKVAAAKMILRMICSQHPVNGGHITFSETFGSMKHSASSRDRLEAALERIGDPQGEGARTCLTVYREGAKAAAEAADARARAGISLGPLDGVIVTIKDLFDVAGEVTRAGSKVLAEEG